MEAIPVCCKSDQAVIRKGYNDMRKIPHLAVFEKKTYLCVPSIRMYCVNCELGFSWMYDFIGPKQRYSHVFRSRSVAQALGATLLIALGCSKRHLVPCRICTNQAVPVLCQQLIEQAWEEAFTLWYD